MRNKDRVKRQNVVILIMNIVIVVLCILLLFTGALMVEELKSAFTTYYNEGSMVYNIETGAFDYLVEQGHVVEAEEVKVSREAQEFFGVAKYFEAAFFYKAYEEVGDTERAARQKEKMEQAYEEMGSWNIVQKDIHETLGLE